MKAAWFALALALLLQVATLDGFLWLCEAAYGERRTIEERHELPLTFAGLALAGPLALLCATAATFLFLRRARPWFAVPCVVLFCVPSVTAALLFTHVLGCVRNWW